MSRSVSVLLVVALIALVFMPTLLHPARLLYPRDTQATDLTITHWPAVAFNVHALWQDGQIPLWRTTIASGGPWAANPQSWLFYPPAWLFFLLPINLTFNLLLLGHVLLAALAAYAFGRRALVLSPPGAALAGLAFALAPWISAQLAAGHVNVTLALAWLPVALIGSHRAATKGRLGGALLAGLAWAASALNHPQIAVFTAVLTLAWFLLMAFTAGVPGRRKRLAILILAVPTLALLLSAALLIPLVEALPYLNRGMLTAHEAGVLSLPWSHLLTIVIPTYGGEPEQAIYLGLPVAILAAIGFALRRDRAAWFLATTAALAALFALGTNGPLFPHLFRLLPGLGWLRVPPRAWLIVAFSMALLAGRGLDALKDTRLSLTTQRRVTLLGPAILVIGLTLAVSLAILYQPIPPAIWALAGLTLLTTLCLVLRARSLLKPSSFVAALLLLVAADLGLVHSAWTEMRSPADAFSWGSAAAGVLAGQPGEFRVYSPDYSLPQHTAFEHGLLQASGVDPFQLADYAAFLSLAGGYETAGYSPSLPPRLDDAAPQPNAALLGLLNVGYVAASSPLEVEGLTLHEQAGGTYIYQNERVLPRAFVVAHEQPMPGEQVTLDRPIQPTPARLAEYTPNHIVVEATATVPGLLVLSEVWYPGWRATVDGGPTPIHLVEGVLRGVYLETGAHRVEFRYAPWTVWAGLSVSGLTALALLTYAATGLWKHCGRRSASPGRPMPPGTGHIQPNRAEAVER